MNPSSDGKAVRVVGSPERLAAATAEWQAGGLLVCGEWRNGLGSNVKYPDHKRGGVMAQFAKVTHTVEGGNKTYIVEEMTPRGTILPDDYVVPFTKGDRVVVRVFSISNEKDSIKVKGTIEKL